MGIFLVNTETKEIARINKKKLLSDSCSVLQVFVKENLIFANFDSISETSKLAILTNVEELKDLNVKEFAKVANWETISVHANNKENFIYKIESILKENIVEELLHWGEAEGYLWKLNIKEEYKEVLSEFKELWENNEQTSPFNLKDDQKPMCVVAHGGPHGAVMGLFTFFRAFMLLNGYSILGVNFTGSAGFG